MEKVIFSQATSTLTPLQVIELLRTDPQKWAFLDVRSEKEFGEGAVPGFVNSPILKNHERHLVGMAYKMKGQDEAIRLGHDLVQFDQSSRVAEWHSAIEASNEKKGIVTCWRGGLRSKIACDWISQAGDQVCRVEGGYKQIRKLFLDVLANPPPFLVLSGRTGSGKTRLLKTFDFGVDLEGLAHHRGSCLGSHISQKAQPSQAQFENALALALWDREKRYLLEDESTRMGSLFIPAPVKAKMKEARVVVLELPLADRVENVFREYILEPAMAGVGMVPLREHFLTNMTKLEKHLGGLRYQAIRAKLLIAFQKSLSEDSPLSPKQAHLEWIELLLTQHYDPTYDFAFSRLTRPILFKGHYQACLDYLSDSQS